MTNPEVKIPEPVAQAARDHKYKILFATISGAHLYGFPSPDSDYDLRGVHVLPLEQVVGLSPGEETVEISALKDGVELDLVTHDAKKFFNLMLKKNGYVLEQLYSPLIIKSSPQHDELKEIGKHCITRFHFHHYCGFAANQWKLFCKEEPRRVKPLLYVYRVLLTGIYLMKTGRIEANISILNKEFCLPYIDELVRLKVEANEKQTIDKADMEFHLQEYGRLLKALEDAGAQSKLPSDPSAKPALDDLLKRLRLSTLN